MSANDAYSIFETIAKLSGTMHRLKKLTPEGHEITDEEIAKYLNEDLEKVQTILDISQAVSSLDIAVDEDGNVSCLVKYADLIKWWSWAAKITNCKLYIGQAIYRVGGEGLWQNPEEIPHPPPH